MAALTDAKLRNLVNKKDSPCTLSHRDGLRVKRNMSGVVLWQYRCRFEGKQVIMSLGHYPQVGLKDAQDLVPLLKGWIKSGLDPRVAYKKHLLGDVSEPTVSDLAKSWLEVKVPSYKPKTQELYTHHLSKWIIPYLDEVPANEMTPILWTKYFDMVTEEGTAKLAGNMLVRLKTVLRWAAMRGEVPQGNTLFNLQVKDIGEPATVGQRFLQFNEIALLWRQIEQAKATPANKACLQLIFLTGARQSEVRLMKWEDLNLKNNIWTVPPENSKTNQAIRRPISKKMRQILENLALVYGKSGIVIPGSNPKKPITTHAVNRFCARMWQHLNDNHKVAKFVPHDARRSLSTLLIEQEVLPHVIEKMLGHAMRGVMAVYNKHDYLKDQAKAYELYWDKIEVSVLEL
ncbi:tyrosine-type recombinase/integrase [Pseudoalteromonas luteoviolacea]|uniref:tyrosine-type recombinase/integrase n=1 Tax=Pseudoalteromonas luteoviolacea TaxID=43657 RepID=UPI001B38176F|nr:site-specific integrase [Pseudoalteromonas luteoviolacea]MBQ4809926.1 tyrosine-type recombinase/integrase [Pseudoalteromonas luteoviolacea]